MRRLPPKRRRCPSPSTQARQSRPGRSATHVNHTNGSIAAGLTWNTSLVADKSNVAIANPRGILWNGFGNTNNTYAAMEQGTGQVSTFAYAMQVGSTVNYVTWNGLQGGTGRIWDLTGTQRTWGDFVSNGGSVQTASAALAVSFQTVTVPSGWCVEYDTLTGVNLTPGATYYHQTLDNGVAGNGVRATSIYGQSTIGTGDRYQPCANVSTSPFGNANTAWTNSNSSSAAGLYLAAPIATYGTAPTGTNCWYIAGDSINSIKGDLLGDAWGVTCAGPRSLNLMEASFIRASFPSASAHNANTYGGYGIRMLVGKVMSITRIYSNMGHNDFGYNTSAVAGVQTFNLTLYNAMPGATFIQLGYTPFTQAPMPASATTSSGTTASITNASYNWTSVFVAGQLAYAYGTSVAGYNGLVTLATVSSSGVTYTLPNGGTGLAAGAKNANTGMTTFLMPGISGIAVSGGLGTATCGDTSKVSVGALVYIGGTGVTGLDGVQIVTAVNTSAGTFSFATSATSNWSGAGYYTQQNAGGGLYNGNNVTGTLYTQFQPWGKRTGPYQGQPFVPANGDPQFFIDVNALDAIQGFWPDPLNSTMDGTHPLGANDNTMAPQLQSALNTLGIAA